MRVRSSSSLSGLRTVDLFPVFPRVFAPGLSWLPLTGFDFAGVVDWLILAPRSRNPHSQSDPFSRFVTFWRLCEASWSPPLFPRSLRHSLLVAWQQGRTQKMSRGGFQITEKTGERSEPFQLGGRRGGGGLCKTSPLPPSEKFLKFDQYLMPFAVNSRK